MRVTLHTEGNLRTFVFEGEALTTRSAYPVRELARSLVCRGIKGVIEVFHANGKLWGTVNLDEAWRC